MCTNNDFNLTSIYAQDLPLNPKIGVALGSLAGKDATTEQKTLLSRHLTISIRLLAKKDYIRISIGILRLQEKSGVTGLVIR